MMDNSPKWSGGVRVAILNAEGAILLVRQQHGGEPIWMLPGGAIEAGETSKEAAVREAFEETGLRVEVGRLLFHVEEASEGRGQRFVNFFLAEAVGGDLALGRDPELGDAQVLDAIGFFSKGEVAALPRVYPEFLRDAVWDAISGMDGVETYRVRSQ